MKRIEEIDILRGVAMLMVVVGHTDCPQLIHGLVSYVHIPLFFMLSGCTNRPDEYYFIGTNIKKFVWKRVIGLYIPFLMFAMLITALHNAFYTIGVYETNYTITDYLHQILRTLLFSVGTNEPMLRQLWFMKSLFLCEIIYAIFVYISHKANINKWVLMGPIISIALVIKGSGVPQVLNSNLLWPLAAIVFYVIGGWISRYITLCKYRVAIIVPFLVIWFLAAYYCPHHFQMASGLYAILQMGLGIGAFLSFWIVAQYVKRIGLLNSCLTYVGRNTIPIYFQHVLCFYLISILTAIMFFPDSYQLIKTNTHGFIPELNWGVYAIGSTILCLTIYYLYRKIKSVLNF